MFKTTALTTLAIASILPLTAVAESPNWTFVEASYLSSELDNDDPGFRNSDNFEPDGFEVAGSYGFGKWGFVDLTYSEESNDENVLFSIVFSFSIGLLQVLWGDGTGNSPPHENSLYRSKNCILDVTFCKVLPFAGTFRPFHAMRCS